MHEYKILLQAFLAERIKLFRKGCGITQETMAERLHITPRSYAYLERGVHGFSAATLMFFFLILPEEDVLRLLMEFRAQVEKECKHVVA